MRGPVLSFCLGLAAAPALADGEKDVLARLFSAPPEAAQFAPAFLAAVPLPQITALIADLGATIGLPVEIRLAGDQVVIITETHRLRGQIGLDGQGRIALLYFQPPEPRPADLDAALTALRALGTDVAWLATREGEVLTAGGADRPMAVGSAFKLGVLAVLAQDIGSGARRWDDVVVLTEADRSLPTGTLQDFPPDAPLTLHTAAALMISVSDNTATDLLIRTLGRDRVSAALGTDSLLTTREFFALKADPAAAATFLAAPPADRAALAAQAAATLPGVSRVVGPHVPGVEWYLPLDRLCALAEVLADLPVMAMNPGPVPATDWARIAYKGGSEPGVLNFTAVLRDAQGRDMCVAITVNHATEIDLSAATAAYRALLSVLAESG